MSAKPKKEQPKKKKSTSPVKNEDGLTTDQAVFLEKYLQTNNAWQSAIDAGYTNPQYAYELLKKPLIKRAIIKRKNQMLAVHKKESQTVINLAFELVKANIKHLAAWDAKSVKWKPSKDMTWGEAYAIGSLKEGPNGREIKLDTAGRAKALDFLGRYFGLWNDKDAIEDMISRLPEEIRDPLRVAIMKHQQKGKSNGTNSTTDEGGNAPDSGEGGK